MYVGTNDMGAFNIKELFISELRRNDLPYEEYMSRL
jgi:hypothetical protein